ncbi:unnamed protein product [Thlaspi arvense]|uniref:Uncharacterized protein n=1 Tax=Thlaspi arvense TaxID=13288 RepID=A0AAU9RFG8_THLAR|nr:unnamed protein product [Thlaspi arvense]
MDYGSNLAIRVINTRIWPEHRSFNDDRLKPVLVKWKEECVARKGVSASSCNRKLIGARLLHQI